MISVLGDLATSRDEPNTSRCCCYLSSPPPAQARVSCLQPPPVWKMFSNTRQEFLARQNRNLKLRLDELELQYVKVYKWPHAEHNFKH